VCFYTEIYTGTRQEVVFSFFFEKSPRKNTQRWPHRGNKKYPNPMHKLEKTERFVHSLAINYNIGT
jgi:hypothetical protein